MIILDRPNFPPYICIACGTGGGPHRKWFLSLNLPLDNYFNPVNEGNVFYCNECWSNLVAEVSRDVQTFVIGHEAYIGVPATFDNQDDLIVGEVTSQTAFEEPVTLKPVEPVGILQWLNVDDQGNPLSPEGAESDGPGTSDQSVSTSSGTATDSNTSTVGSDPQPSDNPAVNEFLEHFGSTENP